MPSSHQHSKECKSCHLPITDGQAYKLGTDQWHVPCFKCSKCSKALGVDSNFLVLGTGALVCSDCSYTCKSCGKKIFDLAILTGDLAYCADCFKCKSCNKPIDDLKYARTSKGLFCMPCHNMLMEKKKKYEKMKQLKKEMEEKRNSKLNKEITLDISLKPNDKTKNNDNDIMKHNDKIKNDESNTNNLKDDINKNKNNGNSNNDDDNNSSQIQKKTQIQLRSPKTRDSNSTKRNSMLIKPQTFEFNNSSTSTFDVGDYADSNETQNELASSIYSSKIDYEHEHNHEHEHEHEHDHDHVHDHFHQSDERKGSIATGVSLEKVDSSPIEKFDVALGFDVKSPGTEKIKSTAIFENDNNNNNNISPIPIPDLKHNDEGFSHLYNQNDNSDISIPVRSPRRAAMSPVRNTTQFRTPELETPKKKLTPKEILSSPGSVNRNAFILDKHEKETELEVEPESFINLDETEEESLMSVTESEDHDISNNSNSEQKLLSPMKMNQNQNSSNNDNGSSGLNIKGLQTKNTSEIISLQSKQSLQYSNTTQHDKSMNTPKQQSYSNFDDKDTPNSRMKQIGGIGRSLTKVFARGRRNSNEGREHYTLEPSTPETITESPSSNYRSSNSNIKSHSRTQSDHSHVAFTTPPIPPVNKSYHTRSISESTTFEIPDPVSSTEKELQSLKGEINTLTLSKAKILKDLQLLVAQKKSLESDISDRQKILKDLDLHIQNKRKLSSTTMEEISSSNLSSVSGRNSSKEENLNLNMSSAENLIPVDHQALPPHSIQQQSQPNSANSMSPGISIPTSSGLSSSNNSFTQSSAQLSQSKDKRSGFMRRIFGNHATGISTTGLSVPNSSSSNKTVGNISQPMNVRHNDESVNFNDKNNDNQSHLSGMKSSRSTNFMQWRSNANNSNNSATSNLSIEGNNNTNSINNSNSRTFYNMTIQELVDYEGGYSIPFIVKTCISEVEKRGSKTEGIYRISASTSTVEKIEQFFEIMDIHNSADINKMHSIIDGDIHALAGLLKRYLKKIPDPIIPQELYNSYISIAKIDNDQVKLERLTEIIDIIPDANKNTLYALLKHLTLIADNERWTKMNSSSLATVFAPTLIRHNSLHPQEEIQDNKSKTLVTELLFKKYPIIFDAVS